MTTTDWSVSGLCIVARPEDLTGLESSLNQRPGVEVHACDPSSGKLVVVQECTTVEEHRDGLREIQALPGVICADLVMLYQDIDETQRTTTPGGAS